MTDIIESGVIKIAFRGHLRILRLGLGVTAGGGFEGDETGINSHSRICLNFSGIRILES